MQNFKDIQPRVLVHRRLLHQIPEVGSTLPETAAYVEAQLQSLDIPYKKSSADSGIVALLQGQKPGRCIALRADMDGLPIEEETGLPFSSRHAGHMHACGHDAHTAMLLGAAEILVARRAELAGSVKFLFQANEESCLGAKQMIADGALEDPRVNALVSLHIGTLDTSLGLGQVGIYPGGVMAASDRITITVYGQSGHCSRPEQTVDPISVAASIINTLQTVVSRETSPLDIRVLSFCCIQGGSTYNVIPESVRIQGALRVLKMETRDFMLERIVRIAEDVAGAMRARAEIVLEQTTPVLENDEAIAAFAAEAARSFLPASLVKTRFEHPLTGSEDAAYYHQHVPGVFCFLGSGNPKKNTHFPHHNCRFDIDEDVLWEGAGLYAACALRFLSGSPA